MKAPWLGGVVALALGCGPRGTDGATAADPHRAGGTLAPAPTIAGSVWSDVFEVGATFRLAAGDDDERIEVVATVAEVRGAGDARVARLTWQYRPAGGALAPTRIADRAGHALDQVAENPRGIAFFAADATDAQIAAYVASPSSWMYPTATADQPEILGPGGARSSAAQRDGWPVYCYGVRAEPCGDDEVCGSDVCVATSGAAGIVSISGAWSPENAEVRAEPPDDDDDRGEP